MRNYARMSEGELLAEIEHFKQRLSQLDLPRNRLEAARRDVYSILLEHRRQLLAALRDGRPGEWLPEEQLG